jgi:hypothetical protein
VLSFELTALSGLSPVIRTVMYKALYFDQRMISHLARTKWTATSASGGYVSLFHCRVGTGSLGEFA